MNASDLAARLRALHTAPDLLVLVNVWDAASARTVAAQPRCEAVATASWSIAAARGVADGEVLSRDAMLMAVGQIAAATELPVTADLEEGYGTTPDEVRETIRQAIAAGVVGCNIEDALRPVDDAAARVAAAVGAGDDTGVPLVVNARTDVFLEPPADAAEGELLAEAVRRGRAFLDAGADCVFVPGTTDREVIAALVRELGAVSLLASPASPPLHELERLGVQRVSFGPGPMGVAMAALETAARELLEGGAYPESLSFRP